MIVRENASEYGIVADESPAMRFASQEIRRGVEACCGFLLPEYCGQKNFISLGVNALSESVIAEFDLSDLNEDGFYILQRGGNLYLFGQNEKSVIFAGYELLERFLGVRFVNADCEYFPHCDSLEVPEGAHKFIPYSGQRIYLANSVMRDAKTNLKYKFTSDYGEECGDLGLKSKWYKGIPNAHNSNYYVPKEKYMGEHPEFFSTFRYGNFRVFESATELCYTSGITDEGDYDETPDCSVASITVDSLAKFIADDPFAMYFMFGRLDNGNARCHCARCEAARAKFGGDSGVMIVFLNAVIGEIRKRFRKEGKTFDRRVVTFAYSATINPPIADLMPVSPKVIPDPNLYFRYAPLGADYTFSLFDPRQNPDVRRQIEGWHSLTKNLMIWDYNINFNEYFWYFPNLFSMKENLSLYADLKLSYIMKQGGNNVGPIWHDEIKCYVCSKLFWDLSLSVEDLVREYCDLYFGDGGTLVFDYIRMMEDFFAKLIAKGFRCDLGGAYKEFFDPKYYPLELLQRGEGMIRAAIARVQESELPEKERETFVRRLKTVLLTPLRMMIRNADVYFDGECVELEEEFFALAEQAGIKKTGEVVPIVIDFVSGGSTKYKIVTGQNPTAQEQSAAKLIQDEVFARTGVSVPVVKDDEVYPAHWERAIMIGQNAMIQEFYKQGLNIDEYDTFVDFKGWCVFVHSPHDVVAAAKVFLGETVKAPPGDGRSLEIVAKKRCLLCGGKST